MTWVRVADEGETEAGKVRVFDLDGRRIALCTTDHGHFAIDDVCTHDGGPLDQGELSGDIIECPRHGARFDVTTGAVKALPAVRPVKTYATRVVDGQIEVEIPEG